MKDENLNPFSGSNSIVFSKNNPFMDISGNGEETENRSDRDSERSDGNGNNSLEVSEIVFVK